MLTATIGSVAGAPILYGLGRTLGDDRVRTLATKIPLLGDDDIDRARDLFERHGGAAVCFGRLLPGIRSVVSIPAGFEHMPFWRFISFTTVGSAAWNAALIGVGWALGTQWQRVEQYASTVGYIVLGLVALALLRRAWRKLATA